MKKIVFFLIIMSFAFALSANAQLQKADSSALKKADSLKKDSKKFKISTGVIFLPCASVSLNSFEAMFSPLKCDVPLYFLFSAKRGAISLNPYFMATKTANSFNNFFGVFAEYALSWSTLFIVATKDMSTTDVSVGTGMFIPFPKCPWGNLLLEFKTPTKKWEPSFVTVVMVSGIFKIKK